MKIFQKSKEKPKQIYWMEVLETDKLFAEMRKWSYPIEVEPLDKPGDGGCLPGNGICNVFKANI